MVKKLNGIAASSGIAIGKAYILTELNFEVTKLSVTNSLEEIKRLKNAVEISKRELTDIKEKAMADLGADKAAIFEAHLLILDDPELLCNIQTKIETEQVNAEYALKDVSEMFVSIFESMDNEYMKERASDIRDVSKRILAHLLGIKMVSLAAIQEETIIVANDLTPSDTAQLNPIFVKGFATDIGGRTSHSAIMARSLELPAVVGTKRITGNVQDGDLIIVDGIKGEVIVNPSQSELDDYRAKQVEYLKVKEELKRFLNSPTVSEDGHEVELVANIGSVGDLKGVIQNGAEGVGLFRTEFLYMGKNELPSEDEQFNSYKTVLETLGENPVVIRTLDIGGDKKLPYLALPEELNPFLGVRAIRLCLERQDIFRTQLRALLRASVYGNLKIMFPMIASLDEFRQAKSILLEEKETLFREGMAVAESIEVGIMVEIPSTAVASSIFAKEVDFFSIGTNDLIQYTMAADRMNEKVSYLYQPYNPAILRLVKTVIESAHQEGKWVGMCGEMAGDNVAIPLLLGLGLDEFSMSASSVLRARAQISKLNKNNISNDIEKILSLPTAKEVEIFVKENYK